jgi:hypothetical protein
MSSVPFKFRKLGFLVEVTPFKASSLEELLTSITVVPEGSIFYHLHQRFFRDPDRLPEYPNDLADWAHAILGNAVIAERLANLNLFRSVDVNIVRREISVILAEHLMERGNGRSVPSEDAFIFCQPRLIGFSSGYQASTPKEFVRALAEVDSDVIGYHLFIPKASPGRIANDFAAWFRHLGYEPLAQQLDAFDPYLNSLEDNRMYLIETIEAGIHSAQDGGKDA